MNICGKLLPSRLCGAAWIKLLLRMRRRRETDDEQAGCIGGSDESSAIDNERAASFDRNA
jgi:hypothetical protein